MSVKLLPGMKKVFLYDEYENVKQHPINVNLFIEWLQSMIDSVPIENRDMVSIEFYFLDDDKYMLIYYLRLETDEELAKRQLQHDQAQEKKRAYELEKLAELKAKYE